MGHPVLYSVYPPIYFLYSSCFHLPPSVAVDIGSQHLRVQVEIYQKKQITGIYFKVNLIHLVLTTHPRAGIPEHGKLREK